VAAKLISWLFGAVIIACVIIADARRARTRTGGDHHYESGE
jgi:hypothetical protein